MRLSRVLVGSANPSNSTVSITTSSPAGMLGVMQTVPLLDPVALQLVVNGQRAAWSWSRIRVATAAFTALGVTMAMDAKDSANAAATNTIVVLVFILLLLFPTFSLPYEPGEDGTQQPQGARLGNRREEIDCEFSVGANTLPVIVTRLENTARQVA